MVRSTEPPTELRTETIKVKVQSGSAFLHGHVFDSDTGKPLGGVNVRLEHAEKPEKTNVTCRCLLEIGGRSIESPEFDLIVKALNGVPAKAVKRITDSIWLRLFPALEKLSFEDSQVLDANMQFSFVVLAVQEFPFSNQPESRCVSHIKILDKRRFYLGAAVINLRITAHN